MNCKHRKVVIVPADAQRGKVTLYDVECSWCHKKALANASEEDVARYLVLSNSHIMEGGNYLSFYKGPSIVSLDITQEEHLMEYAEKVERFPISEKEAAMILNYCGEGTDFSYRVSDDKLIRIDYSDNFAELDYDLDRLIDDLARNNYELLEYAQEQYDDGEELPEGYLESLAADEPFIDALVARFYNA